MSNVPKINQSDTSVRFERNPQSFEKEDEGAYVTFADSKSIENLLKIKFGYESSGYDYTRDISLNLNETVILRDF